MMSGADMLIVHIFVCSSVYFEILSLNINRHTKPPIEFSLCMSCGFQCILQLMARSNLMHELPHQRDLIITIDSLFYFIFIVCWLDWIGVINNGLLVFDCTIEWINFPWKHMECVDP